MTGAQMRQVTQRMVTEARVHKRHPAAGHGKEQEADKILRPAVAIQGGVLSAICASPPWPPSSGGPWSLPPPTILPCQEGVSAA